MTEAVPVGEGGMCAVLNLDADKIQELVTKLSLLVDV